ncbi:tyrosine-type recombinase/integrase [Alicyclobacillus sp. SO9]|uniref:tyrosine-type recombinase/integrase n=1 Tax=Alicyclobacillus sp. SO9 TaxID=2665646 RepID=UPI0018E6EEFB|nr:tyrosine-type recombinase/integrase [Alicyclobacillus sp. SO9]QQE77306.1 tyrosine-type recombinase/integrase [Alicyclobacillus sp. SO9]
MPILLKQETQDSYNMLDRVIAQIGIEGLQIYLASKYDVILQPRIDDDIEEITVLDALELFETEDLNLRPPTTKKTYVSELNQFRKFLERQKLNDDLLADCLTGKVLKEYLKHKSGSATTQNKKKAFFRIMHSFFVEQHLLSESDLSEVLKFAKVYDSLPRALSKESVEELLTIVRATRYGLRYFTLFLYMVGTGTRIEEATTLKWAKIRWDESEMTVHGKHHRVDGRKVYGSTEIMDLLRNYRRLVGGSDADLYSLNSSSNKYVFSASKGTNPLSIRTVQEVFRNCVNSMTTVSESLKPSLTPHSLRHTFAVNYLRAGGDLYTLSKLLGHANPKTTAIYAKLTPEELKNAADEVVQYLLRGENNA